MKLADFVEEELCDICGYGSPKRIVEGLFICGKCFRERRVHTEHHNNELDEEQPIRRNKHERSKTRS